jgi:AcrR family transcriptional regulator
VAKKVDKTQRRKDIVQAAMDLFAHQGFEATSISQVAAAAGIGKATVFEYFASKEELIQFAVAHWLEGWMESLDASVAAIEDPEERLRTYAISSMSGFLDDPQALKVMLSLWQLAVQGGLESLMQSPELWSVWQHAQDSISGAVRDGVSQGRFRPEFADQADAIALNLMVYLDGIGMYHLMLGKQIDVLGQVRLHVDLLLASLRA